jgi:tRNA A37 threonylcarbamoyltransferase TsaD
MPETKTKALTLDPFNKSETLKGMEARAQQLGTKLGEAVNDAIDKSKVKKDNVKTANLPAPKNKGESMSFSGLAESWKKIQEGILKGDVEKHKLNVAKQSLKEQQKQTAVLNKIANNKPVLGAA